MEIISHDGLSRLSIEKIDTVAVEGQEPTVQFFMSVRSEDFEGRLKSAWVDKRLLEVFIKQAEAVVQSNSSRVELRPPFSQFLVSFEKINTRGHLLCSSSFQKKLGGNTITVNFETDVTYLEQLRVFFEGIITQFPAS